VGSPRPLIMISFWPAFGFAYVATTLLVSAVSHAVRFGSFRDLIRDHAIIPSRGAPLAACLTLLAEATVGAAALVLLLRQSATAAALLLFAAVGALGIGFLLYIRRLLRRPHTGSGCGCTPLSSPLTPASQLPSAALAVVSATALAAVALLDTRQAAGFDSGGSLSALAPLWGVSLSFLVMLVPASMPSVAADSRR
jgi:hypothetical protein